MRYFDKQTVKTNSNWQNKQFENRSKIDIKAKNRFKKAVREFGYKISDKLWWNSLSSGEQSCVYNEYMDWNNWYSYSPPSGYGYNILVGSALAEKLASITEEDHNERIEFLMSKYSNPSKRRDLVIREILNFE